MANKDRQNHKIVKCSKIENPSPTPSNYSKTISDPRGGYVAAEARKTKKYFQIKLRILQNNAKICDNKNLETIATKKHSTTYHQTLDEVLCPLRLGKKLENSSSLKKWYKSKKTLKSCSLPLKCM